MRRNGMGMVCCLAALLLVGCETKVDTGVPMPRQPVATNSTTPGATAGQRAAQGSPNATAPDLPLGGERPNETTAEAKPVKPSGDLIPRRILFGNPDKARARISPDGKRLAYLAPVEGVLNVFVGPVDDPDAAKPVTKETTRGLRTYYWAYDSQHILYLQDTDGDENWHVYSVDLSDGEITDLTPLENVAAQVQERSHRFPKEILVGLNDRNEQLHDIHRVNVETGERKLVQENPGFASFTTDDDYNVRFATRFDPDGGRSILKPQGDDWEVFIKVPQEDSLSTAIVGFDKTGDTVYMLDSRERDTAALIAKNLESGEEKQLAFSEKADLDDALTHPTENTVLAVAFDYTRKRWQTLDDSIVDDFAYLEGVADGDLEIVSQTLDNNTWMVAYLRDDGPFSYYVYDRENRKASFLFTSQKDLEGLPLAPMHPIVIKSRDDWDLVSYLTLPKGSDTDGDARPEKPLPMVLLVHGGPWARDNWGYNSQHQWLADRGYAVLSVNFRGSMGFGKRFLNAGNLQWGRKMHDDLLDAVAWAEEGKIADPDRVAIMGGSYGGYATLAALTMTPEEFTCGVDIVGPSNLMTLLQTIPPYWKPVLQMFKDRVGDPDTEEGRKLLMERSPLTYVDDIQRPLLIGQGANDPRVKQSESDQIVQAMQEKKIPVTYVLYPDEGHGFNRPENRMSFYAVAEAFLSEHLGGAYEPIGDDFADSTIQVPAGADEVPGVAEALESK